MQSFELDTLPPVSNQRLLHVRYLLALLFCNRGKGVKFETLHFTCPVRVLCLCLGVLCLGALKLVTFFFCLNFLS